MSKVANVKAINKIDANHFAEVLAFADAADTVPQIRVCHIDGQLYQALEGSHRLAAIDQLGYLPELIEIDPIEPYIASDWDVETYGEEFETIGDFAGWLYGRADGAFYSDLEID